MPNLYRETGNGVMTKFRQILPQALSVWISLQLSEGVYKTISLSALPRPFFVMSSELKTSHSILLSQ